MMKPLELIQAIRMIKRQALAQSTQLAQLRQALIAFVSEPANRQVNLTNTSCGLYTRILLNSFDDDFQIVVVLWGPQSASPIHDHNGTVGAVAALAGHTIEAKYQILRTEAQRAWLQKQETSVLEATYVAPILPDETSQLHDMVNATDTWAATVHIYLTPITDFYIYEPQPDGTYIMVERKLWFDGDNAWQTWQTPLQQEVLGSGS